MDKSKDDKHIHTWVWAYTSENWFDGDEVDVYMCVEKGCNEKKKEYIPR